MQTILGSTGAIGHHLAKEIHDNYTKEIRLVSRNPIKVHDTDELFPADLTNRDEVITAIKGSDIVYVTIGFPYLFKTWAQRWPPFVDSVIEACMKHNCRLVFFDNIYMYDKNCLCNITEECPHNAPSKKGEIRSLIAKKIQSKIDSGEIQALFARCADFYGPGEIGNSLLSETVIKPLKNKKPANWLSKRNYKHSFTYVPDAAKGTAILGNDEKAYNQTWHLPTADNPPTGKEWINMVAMELGVKPRNVTPPMFIMKIAGLFDRTFGELPEMNYQYDRDYVFNSSKFNQAYNFNPTPYSQGIKEVIQSLKD